MATVISCTFEGSSARYIVSAAYFCRSSWLVTICTTRCATSRLTSFMSETAAIGAELGADRDAVFQSLLASTADGGRDFDSQAGSDNVPMHQAKVIDRSERLRGVDAALRARCGGRLDYLAGCADDVRRLLRVKAPHARRSCVDRARAHAGRRARPAARVGGGRADPRAAWQVEDGNDLLMAERTLAELHEFNRRLTAYAADLAEPVFDVYQRLQM